jgi:hypothetical protein
MLFCNEIEKILHIGIHYINKSIHSLVYIYFFLNSMVSVRINKYENFK